MDNERKDTSDSPIKIDVLKGGLSKMEQNEKVDIVATGKCVMCNRNGEVKVYETKEILCRRCYNINLSLRKK